jgi:signal transduction histidine kinase
MVLHVDEGQPRDEQQQEFLEAVAHTLAGMIERKRAEAQRDATLETLLQSEQQLLELNRQLEDYSQNLEQKVAARTREIEQRRRVAESLGDILMVLNSNRPLDEILDYIVTQAGLLLGSETSAIYHQQEASGPFHIRTVLGLSADLVAGLAFPPDLARALREGEPVAVPDVTAEFQLLSAAATPESASPQRLTECCQALLAVPLSVAGEFFGCLALYYAHPRPFSGEEIELSVAFADQVALAIENARLHRQAEEAAILEERARLARELHDSVTQQLYSLTLLAEGWQRLDRAGKLEDSEEPLSELGGIAQQALKEMRLLVYELRPPDLEAEGLLGALHGRLAAVERRAGVDARLVADDLVDLPAPVEEGLYRIALEALNNALKHAAATRVTVHLHTNEAQVQLDVSDDGCGFVLEATAGGGLGLRTMRERAERLGGTLVIDSAPGQGTTVRVLVET